MSTQIATFGCGCFWAPEFKFGKLSGVLSTAVGYMGGHLESPTYSQVCTDRSGHAEVVQLEFDPAQASYESLVRFFFSIHNPATRNRQGEDIGTQYRSVIFCHSGEQRAIAERVVAELNASTFAGGIVTQVLPVATFWRAEDYHQKYVEQHPGACGI